MAGNLSFDVTARDSASREFLAIAAQLKGLAQQVRDLDGRQARVKVALAGAEQVQARLAEVGAQLRGLPGAVSTRVGIDLDRTAGERLAAVTGGLRTFGEVADTAVGGATRFRNAAQMLMDPAQIPVIASVSGAISVRFRQAAEIGQVGADRLSTGLSRLRLSLVGISAAGGAVQVIGGLGAALGQMSGAALLAPAALLGVSVAYGAAKLAATGFADALTGSEKAQKEAFAKMGPEAQKLVTTLKDLGPAANDFRKAIQDTAVGGFSEQVKAAAGTYLPVLRTGLVGTATQLNGMARATVTAVTSLESIGTVRAIIGDTNTALGAMRMTVANAATGFLRLGGAGSAWLPRFAVAIDAGAAKFDGWTKRITTDGSFDRWVGQGITAFGQLGTILGNVASIGGTVFSAINQDGAGLLATLVGLTTQLRGFLQSTQGTAALEALGRTLAVVGDAVSGVLMAALRQLGPIMTALAPAVQTLAVALGTQLVAMINLAGPVLERFAAALSANPELLATLARAAVAVAVGFAPMVAIIGVAATVLKGMLLAAVVGAVLTQLGLAGGVAGRVLQALVSPMALLRELMPLIARGAGMLFAQLGIMAGPVGILAVALVTLYASSEQFRAAANGVAEVLGGIFMQALSDAGEILDSTVMLIGNIGAALGSATSGIRDFGSSVAAGFGPVGAVVEGALGGLFDLLGKLPGAALLAYGAFLVFGRIAPLFAAASAAAAGFSARMLALQASSAAGAAAAGAAGRAAAGLSTALSRAGSALPILGVALIAVGAIYDQIRSRADDFAQSIVQGSMSMSAAFEQEAAIYGEGISGFMNAIAGGALGMTRWTDANLNASLAMAQVRAKTEEYLGTLGPLEEAEARVQISAQNLQDLRLSGSATTQQLSDASRVLARDEESLAGMQRTLTDATQETARAIEAQQAAINESLGTHLSYEASLRGIERAQITAAEATRDHGAGSLEAREAVGRLEESVLSATAAAGRKAAADSGATDETEKNRIATAASTVELLRWASGADGPAKDAALRMLGRLSATELQTLQSTGAMEGFGVEIRQTPDGKAVTVTTPGLDAAREGIKSLTTQILNIQGKQVSIMVSATGSGGLASAGRLATGGILPGYTPGQDPHRFVSATGGRLDLSGGEAVMRPEWTRAVSPSYVHAANRAARSGGVGGVRAFLSRTAPRPGEGRRGDGNAFAAGGIIGRPWQRFAPGGIVASVDYKRDMSGFNSAMAAMETRAVQLGTEASGGNVLAWARTQVGKPYVWGGVGPGGYDCSGFMSALVNVMRGRGPHSRIGATGNFPWAGFRPGIGPGLSIGSFRGDPGHMAGTIAGTNVESSGGVGVRVGGGARGASNGMFTTRAHIFDRGGILEPGGVGLNLSGRPERVLDPDSTIRYDRQIADAQALRRGAGMAAGGGPTFGAVVGELGQLRRDMGAAIRGELADAVRSARPITVQDMSGNPVETARATAWALHLA